jgi:hypothetical protein
MARFAAASRNSTAERGFQKTNSTLTSQARKPSMNDIVIHLKYNEAGAFPCRQMP